MRCNQVFSRLNFRMKYWSIPMEPIMSLQFNYRKQHTHEGMLISFSVDFSKGNNNKLIYNMKAAKLDYYSTYPPTHTELSGSFKLPFEATLVPGLCSEYFWCVVALQDELEQPGQFLLYPASPALSPCPPGDLQLPYLSLLTCTFEKQPQHNKRKVRHVLATDMSLWSKVSIYSTLGCFSLIPQPDNIRINRLLCGWFSISTLLCSIEAKNKIISQYKTHSDFDNHLNLCGKLTETKQEFVLQPVTENFKPTSHRRGCYLTQVSLNRQKKNQNQK